MHLQTFLINPALALPCAFSQTGVVAVRLPILPMLTRLDSLPSEDHSVWFSLNETFFHVLHSLQISIRKPPHRRRANLVYRCTLDGKLRVLTNSALKPIAIRMRSLEPITITLISFLCGKLTLQTGARSPSSQEVSIAPPDRKLTLN